jgi:hypothetical protein
VNRKETPSTHRGGGEAATHRLMASEVRGRERGGAGERGVDSTGGWGGGLSRGGGWMVGGFTILWTILEDSFTMVTTTRECITWWFLIWWVGTIREKVVWGNQ